MPPEQTVHYVSPTGNPFGTATDAENAVDLQIGLGLVQNGNTVIFMDGIYITPDIVFPDCTAACTVQADTGARPVFTTGFFKTPHVTIGKHVDINGLWFGGVRDETINPELSRIEMHDSSTLRNSVIWSMLDGVKGMDYTGESIKNNLVVNCGWGALYHSIYISNANAGHSATIQENVLIGGQAYHIQCWHTPQNVTILNNFSGDADACVVPEGNNHTCDGNIWWKPSSPGYPVNLSTGTGRTYRDNYHGPIASGSTYNGHLDWFGSGSIPAGITASGNYYYTGTQEADPSPTYTNDGDETTLLGKSAAQIDEAISALEASFAESVATIQADATISTHWATLQAVINAWKA